MSVDLMGGLVGGLGKVGMGSRGFLLQLWFPSDKSDIPR